MNDSNICYYIYEPKANGVLYTFFVNNHLGSAGVHLLRNISTVPSAHGDQAELMLSASKTRVEGLLADVLMENAAERVCRGDRSLERRNFEF